MELIKVFNIQAEPRRQEIFEISHKLNFEYYGNGNDSFYAYNICDKDETGMLTEKEYKLFNSWLIKNGAIDKDEVIINHWW